MSTPSIIMQSFALLSIVTYNMRDPIHHSHTTTKEEEERRRRRRVLNFGLLCTFYDYSSHNVLLL